MRIHKKAYAAPVAVFVVFALIGLGAVATAEAVPSRAKTKRTISPSAVFQTLDAYEKAIGERGVLLKGENVWMMAPATRSQQAEMILPYLAKGYSVMHEIVGVHTKHTIMIYALPKSHPAFFGGIKDCVMTFVDTRFQFKKYGEWKNEGMPHIYSSFQVMAGAFTEEIGVRFGSGFTLNWHLGAAATLQVANNKSMSDRIARDRQVLHQSHYDYRSAGNVVPRDLSNGLTYRIYAHLLWECEQAYGSNFWYDFYDYVLLKREKFEEENWSDRGSAALRDGRYELTVYCFSRLEGLNFRKRLRAAGISPTVSLHTLQNDPAGWNRRLK